jgi:chromosome segregation ATPase
MLDAFRDITGNKGKQVQQQTDELELLIVSAREERSAISTMLTALTTRSAKLMPLAKSLEQVGEKAMSVSTRLDDIARRLTALDDRTHEIEEVDKRIQALKDAAKQAEQTTQKAVRRELRKHREAVQRLSSEPLQTQASLAALKKSAPPLRTSTDTFATRPRSETGHGSHGRAQGASIRSDRQRPPSRRTTGDPRGCGRRAGTAAMATVKGDRGKARTAVPSPG